MLMRGTVKALLLAALASAIAAVPAVAAELDKFGFASTSAELSSLQAGAHPDFTTGLSFSTDPSTPLLGTDHWPYAYPRDVRVELPPGLVGNLGAIEECSAITFVLSAGNGFPGCPFSSQVGVARIRLIGQSIPSKASIFKLEASGGNTVARFGFIVLSTPVFINAHVRTDGDYGVTAEVTGIAATTAVIDVETTLWGVPGDISHNNERFDTLETNDGAQESPPRSTGIEPKPFMTNPTACGQPLTVTFEADSYQESGRFVRSNAPLGTIEGCDQVPFAPTLVIAPTNPAAGAPSGADATLTIPQDQSVGGRASSQLRNAVIKLPEGVSISPGAADGLVACSAEQVGYKVSPPVAANCPPASKIASAEIDSPALTQTLHGAFYQRTPEPGHLTRGWLVADELGLHIKIPGEFKLDPKTGQITSLFLETPQVPVSEFRLHFKGGDRGVLATPRRCGTYESEYTLSPWAGGPDATGTAPMTFDQNCDAGGFTPHLAAGTDSTTAGAFTSLITELTQASGEQNLERLEVTMPEGVLARLRGMPVCPDDLAAGGNCPAATVVGRAAVASGPGPRPLWIPQPGREPTMVYFSGPYKGAPYSLVVRTPVQAGPFDLGVVVVRVALAVDPTTAQVTAVSDPLPQILEGVPVAYRNIRVEIDRPEFAINPTSCDVLHATGHATSAEGATAAMDSRFQVGGCRKLGFKPKLKMSFKGSPRRTGHPAVSATLRMPSHGANIDWVRVWLPKSEQIDNAHINTPCTRVQFNEDACPPKSILGRARAFSPLLDRPLEGPVYFRSNGGARELPDLVADLRGQIHVVLVGFIDAKNERIRNTFATVPDAPVSKFRIQLYGGKRGLLINNRDLCKSSHRAKFQFDGQNGKTADSISNIAIGCAAHRHGKSHR